MKYVQGDIVNVFLYPLKQGDKEHPGLIISNDDVNSLEEKYLCLMLTGSNQEDEFSFFISDKMTTKPLSKNCVVRVSLFASLEEDLSSKKRIPSKSH